MKKPIVNMTDWQIYVVGNDDYFSLSGTADNHPSIGKHAYVNSTSMLESYSFENDILLYETRNTRYVCPLKYLVAHPYKNYDAEYKLDLLQRANKYKRDLYLLVAAELKLSLEMDKKLESGAGNAIDSFDDSFLTHIKELQVSGRQEIEQAKQLEEEHLIECAAKHYNCVYLEVSDISRGDKLAYCIDGHKGVIKPILHVGTVQDSVLYMTNKCEGDDVLLDFRYFPKGWLLNIMDTYKWSDNIANVIIKNTYDYPISFNKIQVAPGETKKFPREKQSKCFLSQGE